jgi:hypothetical protein
MLYIIYYIFIYPINIDSEYIGKGIGKCTLPIVDLDIELEQGFADLDIELEQGFADLDIELEQG